jgi:hypothetical protein
MLGSASCGERAPPKIGSAQSLESLTVKKLSDQPIASNRAIPTIHFAPKKALRLKARLLPISTRCGIFVAYAEEHLMQEQQTNTLWLTSETLGLLLRWGVETGLENEN